ncbi:unnamed protein product [Microthlaspi erraticum]|uniref:Uncharacterized protein n=1 Tax=Microthlaspi erraticum TaxID=1685480 RepID=A0A6D2HZG3_9BRAS|nr:unnamed protein product [Microthlaspi erraticum]
MDPIASVMEKAKCFAKSSQDLVSRHFGFHENPSRQNPVSSSIPVNLSIGIVVQPLPFVFISFLRRGTGMDSEPSAQEMSRGGMKHVPCSSVALKLDSQMDESTRVGGWIEVQNSREKQVKWSVSITDKPEDEVGWGMSVGGSRNHDRFQVESFLKFNVGHRFSLSRGLVYHTNSNGRAVGLMLQSHWSL